MAKHIARQPEREIRAQQPPIVLGLPQVPGIRVAIGLSPELKTHLLGLADTLLVKPFPGSSLSRFDSEVIATAVSAANNCFFCMDSHAAHGCAVAKTEAIDVDAASTMEHVKGGSYESLSPVMQALVKVALNVCELSSDFEKNKADVDTALELGSTPGDISHTVAIAATFSMYNRLVEGLGAITPADTSVYEAGAQQIATHGYSQPI